MTDTHPTFAKSEPSPAPRRRLPNALPYFFLFALSLLLYVRTLAPGLLDGDSAEFQLAAWNFSLVHPTGYPLYLLLGGFFSHVVPFGNPAYRMNLLSALFASGAVAILCAAIFKLTNDRYGHAAGDECSRMGIGRGNDRSSSGRRGTL